MTKKVNKHITESEDFFNRLETGDHEALDDFEKEAMEGFESLENPELAKSLHDSLNRDIEEAYFKKEKNNTFWYLSIAAGLILIIGLSIIFFNFMEQEKEELAMSPEKKEESDIRKEAKTFELAAPAEEVAAAPAKDESKPEEKSFREPPKETIADKKDEGVRARSVLPLARNNQQPADAIAENSEGLKDMETRVNAGPPVNTVALAEEQKAFQQETVASKTEPTLDKDVKRDEAPGKPVVTADLAKKESEKQIAFKREETNKKSKAKEADQRDREDAPSSAAKLQTQSTSAVPAQGNISANDDNAGYYETRFSNANYTKAREYVKAEIDKNALLKDQVKTFKAKLNINKDGIVTKVKFLTPMKDCPGCEKELEHILMDMPPWQSSAGKKAEETIEFVYP